MNQILEDTVGLASAGGFFRRRGKHMHVPVGEPCPNCETTLQGPWCFNCGQAGEELHRSVWKLAAEAFEGLFHADGRLWKTLPNLLIKPGKLTRDYLDGHRVPQVPPFRMFLVILLVVFFTGHMSTAKHEGETKLPPITMDKPTTPKQRAQARVAMSRAREQLVEHLGPAAGKSFDANMAPALRKIAAEDRAYAAQQAAKQAAAERAADAADADSDTSPAGVAKGAAARGKAAELAAEKAANAGDGPSNSDADSDGASEETAAMNGDLGSISGFTKLNLDPKSKGAMDQWFSVRLKAIRDNPKQFEVVMESWAHRIAILTLPVSAIILTTLFAFNRRFYVFDHLVFSMHSLSFQLLLLSLIFLLSLAVGGVAWWLTLLMPIHLYKHMRGVYGRGRWGTLLTMFVLFIGTSIGFSFLALLWFAVGFNDMGAA